MLFLLGLGVTILIGIASLVWWSVGVWRSASNTALRGRRAWAFAAKITIAALFFSTSLFLFVIATPQLTDAVAYVEDDPAEGPRAVTIDGNRASISGFISWSVLQHFEQILNNNPKVSLVVLEGPGGRIMLARRIRDLIAFRGINTLVENTCVSACAIAYLGGRERLITRDGKLGFHAATAGPTVATSINGILTAEARLAGVSEDFAVEAFSTNTPSGWFPSLGELVDARVVTKVLQND
jgi:hypothetical protein